VVKVAILAPTFLNDPDLYPQGFKQDLWGWGYLRNLIKSGFC